MKCPKCVRRLKAGSTSCMCGWGGASLSGKMIPCHFADQGCGRPARFRTARYSLGDVQWPLCFECDERLHLERVEAWCLGKGLKTIEQRRNFCKRVKYMPKPTTLQIWQRVSDNPKAPVIAQAMALDVLAKLQPQREPGED